VWSVPVLIEAPAKAMRAGPQRDAKRFEASIQIKEKTRQSYDLDRFLCNNYFMFEHATVGKVGNVAHLTLVANTC